MTLNKFWWWGSISENLLSVNNFFIIINSCSLRPGMAVSIRAPFIDLFENYSIGPCAKNTRQKLSRSNYTKNVNMETIPF